MQIVTEKELKNEISDMREQYPRLQDNELFVAWFLKCFVTEREEEAIHALVGGSRDKSLDALLIDDSAKVVFLVQGKYRQKANGTTEHRSDVTAFADLANAFLDDEAFKSWIKDLDIGISGKAQE